LDWVWSENRRLFSLFPFSRVLFYAIWKVEANKKGLKLNGLFSFWSILIMLADCVKTNLHISKGIKGGGGEAFLFASKYFSLVEIAELKVGKTRTQT